MRRAGLIAGLLGALIIGPVTAPEARADGSVDYQGLRIPVPAGWKVYRLGADSTECLRYDRHAIYLGRPGANQICPAHSADRTEAIHVEPLDDQARSLVWAMLGARDRTGRAGTDQGRPSGLTVRDPAGHEVTVALPGTGALITGSYGSDPKGLDRVLSRITAAPVPSPGSGERRSTPARPHRWVTGYGFDTCTAPSLRAMSAWRKDFVAANIYIGGPARSCPDGRLSRDWVAAVRTMGWRLIPTYVGPQAPCARRRVRFPPEAAVLAGELSAEDAVRHAAALGLPRHTPIYLDVEAYDRRDAVCRLAVLDFVDAWTKRLRRLKYIPGVYSSVASGIRDIGEATGISKPPVVWFAHWDDSPDPHADRYVPEAWWPGHRRIKQYRGDHLETHGGYTLQIDGDAVDGYVR